MQAYLHRLLVFMNSFYSTSTGRQCIVRIAVNLIYHSCIHPPRPKGGFCWFRHSCTRKNSLDYLTYISTAFQPDRILFLELRKDNRQTTLTASLRTSDSEVPIRKSETSEWIWVSVEVAKMHRGFSNPRFRPVQANVGFRLTSPCIFIQIRETPDEIVQQGFEFTLTDLCRLWIGWYPLKQIFTDDSIQFLDRLIDLGVPGQTEVIHVELLCTSHKVCLHIKQQT
jgi:hypothetical protein